MGSYLGGNYSPLYQKLYKLLNGWKPRPPAPTNKLREITILSPQKSFDDVPNCNKFSGRCKLNRASRIFLSLGKMMAQVAGMQSETV
ncbi:hypothetical protein Zmor_002359 [Zophobas morio]|uniref:Uncharacterized protein n=1 Tax=Zophobas morio TaxID=2755281 RepID=A0AA38MU08_9CUCU|nr:hypothetical protein Zmor_002359 [Zophobas morio]